MVRTYIKKSILIFSCLFIGLFSYGQEAPKRNAEITIFVHGSIASPFCALNPFQVWRDIISDDALYVKAARSIRNNPIWWQDQPMQAEGLKRVEKHDLINWRLGKLPDQQQKYAVYPMVLAYDALAKSVDNQPVDRLYYTFGHLGLLSQQYRKEMGRRLYLALVQEINRLKNIYGTIKITIIAHSHGGNIALNLADAQDAFNKDLHIDTLVMYGTPIQKETADYAWHPVFGRVINAYSEGDKIQGADRISTQSRRSYKSLFAPELKIVCPRSDARVFDVRLLVNDDAKLVDHTNMWLWGRSSILYKAFDKIPYGLFTPYILSLMDQLGDKKRYIDANLHTNGDEIYLSIKQRKLRGKRFSSKPLHTVLQPAMKTIDEVWKPDDKIRRVFACKKDTKAVVQAVKDWWHRWPAAKSNEHTAIKELYGK